MNCEESEPSEIVELYRKEESKGIAEKLLERIKPDHRQEWQILNNQSGETCYGLIYPVGTHGRCILVFSDTVEVVERLDLENLREIIADIATILTSITPDKDQDYVDCESKNKKLQEFNQLLLSRNQNKDSFIAHLSHELRTPISGILLTAESLETGIYGELNEKQLHSIKNIEKSCNFIISMINELLDIAKLADGKVELQKEVCLVNDICEDASRTTREMFEQKRQQFSFTYTNGRIFAVCDSRRLKQIIINLLSNASKFTDEDGKIELNLNVINKGANEEEVLIEVKDNGFGISESNKSSLFEPFTQFNNGFDKSGTKEQGSGLGLSIVKALVELHEGKIQVSSELNTGSCFRIHLPTKMKSESEKLNFGTNSRQDKKDDVPGGVSKSGNKKVILIVEDNEVNIIGVSEFLKANNFQIITACNGEEGVQKVMENRPDLVLMDVQMPKMDGISATKIIRGYTEPYFQKLPILMYTALGMPGDEERCLETGADEYFMKPFGLRNLVNKINSYLERNIKD